MMSTMDRVYLQRKFVQSTIDAMDISDIMDIVKDHFHDRFEELSDEEFVDEVKFYYPELLKGLK
jgi:hypothetical protein